MWTQVSGDSLTGSARRSGSLLRLPHRVQPRCHGGKGHDASPCPDQGGQSGSKTINKVASAQVNDVAAIKLAGFPPMLNISVHEPQPLYHFSAHVHGTLQRIEYAQPSRQDHVGSRREKAERQFAASYAWFPEENGLMVQNL
ncbi:hypothetical protein EJB05_31277 [Eragrostis curvula]|uniref:Uncharacterized protein n=1 Tax=Eragrostis curvula TaxID=38414 RepID=A0A5J9UES3_9POAL|nr:hypothetical protein EJB05_31277 [Eragrostis curvula]